MVGYLPAGGFNGHPYATGHTERLGDAGRRFGPVGELVGWACRPGGPRKKDEKGKRR